MNIEYIRNIKFQIILFILGILSISLYFGIQNNWNFKNLLFSVEYSSFGIAQFLAIKLSILRIRGIAKFIFLVFFFILVLMFVSFYIKFGFITKILNYLSIILWFVFGIICFESLAGI